MIAEKADNLALIAANLARVPGISKTACFSNVAERATRLRDRVLRNLGIAIETDCQT